MAKIYAPNKSYHGNSAGVSFTNGMAETENTYLVEWFRQHGYTVEEASKEGVSQEEIPEEETSQEEIPEEKAANRKPGRAKKEQK